MVVFEQMNIVQEKIERTDGQVVTCCCYSYKWGAEERLPYSLDRRRLLLLLLLGSFLLVWQFSHELVLLLLLLLLSSIAATVAGLGVCEESSPIVFRLLLFVLLLL